MKKFFGALILFGILIVGAATIGPQKNNQPAAQSPTKSEVALPPTRLPARDAAELHPVQWAREYSTAYGTFKITNTSTTAIKDITLSCGFYGRSGTQIGRDQTVTIYDVIPAKTTRTFTKMRIGYTDEQVHKAGCSIAGAKYADQ